MRILFAGDPHGEFDAVRKAAPADTVIFLGDQTPARAFAEELGPVLAAKSWFLLGNHDSDAPGFIVAHMGEMWRRNLNARVVDFGGLRIAGLGGVFRGRVWNPGQGNEPEEMLRFRTREEMCAHTPRRQHFLDGVPLKHWTSIFPEDFDELLAQGPADVLVCHEAPECHPHGFTAIGDLARALGVKTIVHGHHHVSSVNTIDGGITVHGVGIHQFHVMGAD